MENERRADIISGVEPEGVRPLRGIIVVENLPGGAAVAIAVQPVGALDLINVVGLARPSKMNRPFISDTYSGELERILSGGGLSGEQPQRQYSTEDPLIDE